MMEPRSKAVAILAPTGSDGRLAQRMLQRVDIEARVCRTMDETLQCIAEGVGAVVIAEEALGRVPRAELMASLDRQPTWSDLPVVVLLSEDELSNALVPGVAQLAARGNVTLLERPVRLATLVTTLRSALRARERQYDVRDSIAQRIAAAEELKESEERLRATVLAAPYPLMLHAEDGAILQLSRAWSELSGYSSDELTTMQEWTRRAYGEKAGEADALVANDLAKIEPADGTPRAFGERLVRTRDSSLRVWDFHSVLLGRLPDGRRLRLVAARDVTDFHRLLESERAAREDAEKANRAKMDFLAVMSHELRTPLNAIGGYTQLLELGIHGPVTDSQRQALARIKSSEAHLLGLIEDVLNFAKIEAGRVTFDLKPIPVGELVAEVDALVETQMRAKGIAYVRREAPAVDVMVDPEKARQVILNLLSNAVKFTPGGGRITVGFELRDDEVDISITDTGSGIPLDKQEAIFEPFVQVQRAYNSTQSGTGLGLAISRDLARSMGGGLAVESELDRGSTFVLTLPRAS
jgi:PAS domain S-box-containing protein